MTDRYTRTFADFENHPWPGKILPEYFEQIANAGDGNAGLQRMIHGAISAYGAYHVIEGVEYVAPGVPTEWTGSVGYVMVSGLIRSVVAASGALSSAGEYLIYNVDGTFAVTGAKPTGVVLAKNIGGTVYTVNNRYDTGSNFYLPNELSVYGNTYIKNNLTASGTINLTGTITYIGNNTQSGYTFQTGNVYTSGHIFNTGIIYQSGNTEQVGNIYYTGDIFNTGHLDQVGDISGMYPYNISGYETITADTGQFKHITGYSHIFVDADLDLQGNWNISGVVQITGSLVRVGTANGLTVGAVTLAQAEWEQLNAIGGSTIDAGQWGYLGAMNQHVHSDGDPTFDTLSLDAGGLTVGAVNLTNDEWSQLANIGANAIAAGDWANLAASQPFATTSSPTFANLSVTTNITVGGNVDGVDIASLASAYNGHAAAGNPHSNSSAEHGHPYASTSHDNGNHSATYVTTLDEAFQGGKIIDGATSSANALRVGGVNVNHRISLWASVNTAYISAGLNLDDIIIQCEKSVGYIRIRPQSDGLLYLGYGDSWQIDGNGDLTPTSNFSYDIGNANYAVGNIYANDLRYKTHSAYSHVDDLQLIREAQEDPQEKIIKDHKKVKSDRSVRVWKEESLPWVKARGDLVGLTGDQLDFETTISEVNGFLFSALQKLLLRQDGLVSGLDARDLMIEDLQTRLGVLEGV